MKKTGSQLLERNDASGTWLNSFERDYIYLQKIPALDRDGQERVFRCLERSRMEIRKIPFKETEKGFSTKTTWNIELTHDEVVALSVVIDHYASNLPDIKYFNADELTRMLITLHYLSTIADKFPKLED